MVRRELIDSWMWMWRAVKGVRSRIVYNCMIGVLRIALSLTFVYICKHIVDIATGVKDGDLVGWIGVMVGVMVSQLLVSMWNGRVQERNRIELTNKLRRDLFAKAMNSQWNGRDRLHTGDTMSRLGEDIRSVCDTVSNTIPQIVLATCQLVGASFVLFTLQRELLWVLLIIMPVALVVSKVFFRVLRRLTDKVRNQEAGINSHMQEHLLKRVLIFCMDRLGDTVASLTVQQRELENTVMSRVNYSTRARLIVQLGFAGGYCTAFCWGVFGIAAGTVTYGMMTAFLQLVNQLQSPIVNISHYLPTVVQTITAVNRLRDIGDEAQQMTTSALPATMAEGSVGIRIHDLVYTYPGNDKPTIKHLTFDFKPGRHVAIVGRTGEGKSTLIRILLGLLKPDGGRIELYNSKGDAVDMTGPQRALFSYVPQGNSLMSGTVRDNLLLGKPDATEEEMYEALRLAAADFVFKREERLDTPCNEQGNGLSEGQAQRVAIARALLQPGRIVIFDEACSALDDATESVILNNLDHYFANKTVIWITHDETVKVKMEEVLELKGKDL